MSRDVAFRVEAAEGAARAGTFRTAHGDVQTPAFLPVGTRAAVKGLTPEHLDAIGPQMVLANAYHLHLRPGADRIAALGGLHGFTGRHKPWLTDSGGFQVFSLGDLVAVDESGVTVKSHLDGDPVRLGPVEAVRIQEALGADVAMAFDQCCRLPATREALLAAVDRTTRWAEAGLAARTRGDQATFGILQGGADLELRARSAAGITALPFEGFAIGGLSVGEGTDAMRATLAAVAPLLPETKPRYLMGVGAPLDLIDGVARGVDLFDCVLPSRNGRRGHLFTDDGVVRIGRQAHALEEGPLSPTCRCETCRRCSRAYLHHLFSVDEHSAVVLGTLHNVTFLVDWVARLRAAILEGRFAATASVMAARFSTGETLHAAALAADPDGRLQSRRAALDRAARGRGASPAAEDVSP